MRRFLSVCLVMAAFGLAGCGSSMSPYSGTGGTPPSTSGNSTSNSVSIGNDFFSPSSTTVPVGTTVTWTWNAAGVSHTVTFDDGATGSGVKSNGTFSRTFTTAGTYTYYCQIHGRAVMSGTITVH